MSTLQPNDKMITEYKEDMESLRRRIDNLRKQRDDWALKYAKLKQKYDEGGSTIKSQR